jgi:hypothetical protein
MVSKNGEKVKPTVDYSNRIDFLISEIIFTIKHEKITVSSELTNDQKDQIKSLFKTDKQKNGHRVSAADYKYSKIYVENSGKGAAINIKCRLFKKGHEDTDEFDIYTTPFSIPAEKHFDLGLFFDLSNNIKGFYSLEFMYFDIYMNEYKQIIPLELYSDQYTIDFYQSQIQLK